MVGHVINEALNRMRVFKAAQLSKLGRREVGHGCGIKENVTREKLVRARSCQLRAEGCFTQILPLTLAACRPVRREERQAACAEKNRSSRHKSKGRCFGP